MASTELFFYTLAMLVPSRSRLYGSGWTFQPSWQIAYQSALSTMDFKRCCAPCPSAPGGPDSLLCNLFVANREGVLGGLVTVPCI
jgi:hypothetical protein